MRHTVLMSKVPFLSVRWDETTGKNQQRWLSKHIDMGARIIWVGYDICRGPLLYAGQAEEAPGSPGTRSKRRFLGQTSIDQTGYLPTHHPVRPHSRIGARQDQNTGFYRPADRFGVAFDSSDHSL